MSKLVVAPEPRPVKLQLTVPLALAQPAEAETKDVRAGNTSAAVPPLEVEGPLLLTTRWKVISLPAATVAGALLLMAKSACLLTFVFVPAVLFGGTGSLVDELTEAVLAMLAPSAVLASTRTTMLKAAVAPFASDGLVQLTIPAPAPTAGVVQAQPTGEVKD